jgi:hypothetical protein
VESRRFIVTTVVRGAPLDAVSGRVYVVDLDARRVLMAAPIFETPWRERGTNPRGGHRGGRGVCAYEGRLLIANADEIHVFDRAWQRVDVLSHPLVADIHDLAAGPGGVWACATRADSLVRLDWDGAVRERWSWRTDAALVDRLGYRTVAPVDDSVEYRDMRQVDGAMDLSHPNGVEVVDDGLLVSLGRVRVPSPSRRERAYAGIGAVVHAAAVGRPLVRRIRAERVRRHGADPQPGTCRRGLVVHLRSGRPAEVIADRSLVKWPNHNVVAHGREAVLCDTSRGLVVAIDRDSGAERIVAVPQASRFLRGLAPVDGDRFVVGTRRPGALHLADLATGESEPALSLSDDWHESVHDIAPLPDDWNDPPRTLQ